MKTMKIQTIEQYEKIQPYLAQRLGVDREETISLLSEGEGPTIGVDDSGNVWGVFPPCANSYDDRAFRGSSAGGVVARTHPVAAVVRKLISRLQDEGQGKYQTT
mgnify:FL=1